MLKMSHEAASNRLCILMPFVPLHRRTMPSENLTAKGLGAMDICRKAFSAISELFSAKSPCYLSS
jgi:hypothetical protein